MLFLSNIHSNQVLKKRIGYFVLHNGSWWLVNEGLQDMLEINGDHKITVPVGGKVELIDGKKILL